MAGSIFGALGISDSDRLYTLQTGQQVVYETAQAYVARANAQLQLAQATFVERTTDVYTERYKLPGNGTLQRRGPNGTYRAVKTTGSWDVAFPIEDFGAALSGNDVEMAYMTVGDLSNHIQTVISQNRNTVRFEVLKALLNKSNKTFNDPLRGNITIRALANSDGSLYPPIEGSDDPADAQHYIGLNYTAITNTDNPFITARDLFEDTFGAIDGGYNLVTWINRAQRASVEALTDFVPVKPRNIQQSALSDTTEDAPKVPGVVIGSAHGHWIAVWSQMPAGYLYTQRMDIVPPLIRRIDPADTGLGDGLQLVAKETDFPFETTFWRHRFGYGVGNRLNGLAMQLVASTTYTTPTLYA